MYYEDASYAANRLVGSVVRRQGRPVYIHEIEHDGTVHYASTTRMNGNLSRDRLDSFDLEPLPLGYCNHQGHAKYLMRTPMRNDWRQGLRERTLVHKGSGRVPPLSVLSRVVSGIYPTIQSCVESLVNNEVVSQAFSRTFALGPNNTLRYKEEVVGSYRGDGELTLSDNFSWLRESLEETLHV